MSFHSHGNQGSQSLLVAVATKVREAPQVAATLPGYLSCCRIDRSLTEAIVENPTRIASHRQAIAVPAPVVAARVGGTDYAAAIIVAKATGATDSADIIVAVDAINVLEIACFCSHQCSEDRRVGLLHDRYLGVEEQSCVVS